MRLRLAVLATLVTTLVASRRDERRRRRAKAQSRSHHQRHPEPDRCRGGRVHLRSPERRPGRRADDRAVSPPRRAPAAGTRRSARRRPTRTVSTSSLAPRMWCMTNRSWFVREQGIHQIHSRTVFERVAALVSLAAEHDDRRHRTAGHVHRDGHPEPRVRARRPPGADQLRRLARPEERPPRRRRRTTRSPTAGGSPAITPSVSCSRSDVRNIAGAANPVTVAVQQKQVSGFTINSSDQLISYGQSVTISGCASIGCRR